MSTPIFTTADFQFSKHCFDWIFSNVLESSDEYTSDLDGWKLFEFLLDYVDDLNAPLYCGRFRGESYLRAAVKSGNKRMVFTLTRKQHGTARRDNHGVSILIDEDSNKWIAENL